MFHNSRAARQVIVHLFWMMKYYTNSKRYWRKIYDGMGKMLYYVSQNQHMNTGTKERLKKTHRNINVF